MIKRKKSCLARRNAVTGLRKRCGASMEGQQSQNLSARISNCLQTILELEPDLERLRLGHVLIKEFTILKSFLARMDRIDIDEGDVVRIETATENFLRELKTPLALVELERIRKYIVH
ncbi:hypothetical protein GD604_09400 [Desulfolutivibrio sulfoxidireducens]|nr:hypothetical protein GD605_08550 [Desulfolutivibrio sulfoxidireducens]QLA19932.1 hypothetical protein GD604_09400 [Desulfolutivibrio sulfoxidireducens]